MEEQHKVFIEINELLTNSTNDNDTELLSSKNKTWENLDKLINSSGCLEQICDLIEDDLPNDGILIDNDDTIGLLKLKRKIGWVILVKVFVRSKQNPSLTFSINIS